MTCYPRAKIDTLPELTLAPRADMNQSVLFSSMRLEKLHARIYELDVMDKSEKANFRELLWTKRRLERAKISLNAQITKLRSKCEDLQMLK